MSDFVHLHCHTEYSLLDGAIKLGDLCQTAIDFKAPAAAITDHGNMFGAVEFFETAKKHGVKPILGCEVYVAKGRHTDKAPSLRDAGYHLVLLAQNIEGYHNLVRLVAKGFLDGFHYKPRIDRELLRAHSGGLVALSACLKGEVPQMLLKEGMDAGVAMAREYASIFPDRFYLELQANGLEDQVVLNEQLKELAAATKLPLVATNDCHYLTAQDVEAHDILLCIQTASCVSDEKRMRFGTTELYYRSPEEMIREFADTPEAIENTVRIAESCDVELDLKSLHFPVYEVPEGKTLDDEFRDLSRAGLEERLAKHPEREHLDEAAYWKRLEYELDIICQMGFPGYFLIVQDFINWAKDNDIPVGPGRGSAAGSLVAFALRITNIDPLPYNLLFERFLNVERVSMPDIDVDFCERRRADVIRYVTEKYGGEDHVAQITTFGTMKAKAAVRDVGRALGLTFAETDRIAKLVPNEMKMTLDKALEKEPDLKRLYDSDHQVHKLIDISRRLEGLARHASTHAAGVVISPQAMSEYTPLYRGKNGEVVTQYDMKRVEKVGLIKFDFLGLRTMTLIDDALKNIARQGIEPPDLDTLPLTDEATYKKVYCSGDTDGVFQVESGGMRRYLKMLKPNCFEDVIAMLALYRPGPLGSGMVDEFIKRKHGEVEVTYPHPLLEETLRPTYGVIVYQEQVMKTAQVIGNYSLGEGDILRRAMGKKIEEEMNRQRVRFVEGAAENDIDAEKANEIFDLMEQFAKYGFNKSHSAAYALISYHTAYLKTHFPCEFMAALITSEIENQDKILKYIGSCREMEIKVVPPSVNLSRREFTAHSVDGEKKIVYGLGGVKNVGNEAINSIIAEREENGNYTSLLDLCLRVNLRKVTKRVLEYLIKAGAMDCFGTTRAALVAGLDRVVAIAQKRAKEKESGQMSLLGLTGQEQMSPTLPGIGMDCEEQTLEEWEDEEKLAFEKEALGFYLTSHPLLAYRHDLKRLRFASLDACSEMAADAEVRVPCIITEKKDKYTKKGDKMAICQVEDLTASRELLVFPKSFAEFREVWESEKPIVVTARVKFEDIDEEEGNRLVKLLAEKAQPLDEVLQNASEPVHVTIGADEIDQAKTEALKDILIRHPGRCPVHVHLRFPDSVCRLLVGDQYKVAASVEFWREIDHWSGTPQATR